MFAAGSLQLSLASPLPARLEFTVSLVAFREPPNKLSSIAKRVPRQPRLNVKMQHGGSCEGLVEVKSRHGTARTSITSFALESGDTYQLDIDSGLCGLDGLAKATLECFVSYGDVPKSLKNKVLGVQATTRLPQPPEFQRTQRSSPSARPFNPIHFLSTTVVPHKERTGRVGGKTRRCVCSWPHMPLLLSILLLCGFYHTLAVISTHTLKHCAECCCVAVCLGSTDISSNQSEWL